MAKNRYLTCKRVKFYFIRDEDAFFRWIEKIPCINSYEGAGDELCLNLVDRTLTDEDLRDLIGLLYRYKIDMKQLAQFLTPENEHWFYGGYPGFWHRRVFGTTNKSKSEH